MALFISTFVSVMGHFVLKLILRCQLKRFCTELKTNTPNINIESTELFILFSKLEKQNLARDIKHIIHIAEEKILASQVVGEQVLRSRVEQHIQNDGASGKQPVSNGMVNTSTANSTTSAEKVGVEPVRHAEKKSVTEDAHHHHHHHHLHNPFHCKHHQ